MMNIEKVANLLRGIEYTNDEQWLYAFLDSLPIPKFSCAKTKSDLCTNEKRHARLLNRADIVRSNQEYFSKIIANNHTNAPPIALHIDQGYITVFNRQDVTFLSFHADTAANNLDHFLELIYGSGVSRDIEVTKSFAATIAQLSNQLLTDNTNSKQDVCAKFILDLITIAIVHSFQDNDTFRAFSRKALATEDLDYAHTTLRLMNTCAGAVPSNPEALLPERLSVCIDNPVKEIILSRRAFELSVSILLIQATSLDAELLASSIYKFVSRGESIGTYGHQTTHQNVLMLLEPLLLDELTELFLKGSDADKWQLLDRIRTLKFFDPTDGPGCFLSSSLRALVELEYLVLESLGRPRETHINLSNFCGIVSNPTCQQLAKLTIWLTYLQFKAKETTGYDAVSANYLSLISIHLGDQLASDWHELFPLDANTYIIGCPKFLGSRKMSAAEKAALRGVFNNKKLGDCDLSSGWLVKSSAYISSHWAKVALIMTNSVCQGSQVGIIWPQIFANNTKICFAKPSMKWRGSHERVSEVTVALIGLCHESISKPCRFYHESEYLETTTIGPYLVAGTDLIVYERRKALADFVPTMRKGNMPYDKGYLLLSEDEKNSLITNDPRAATFLKRIVGSDEYINKKKRWCIWIRDEDLAEAKKIPEIAKRIELVRNLRSINTDAGAKRLAERPHQFRESYSTIKQTLIVPSVSSENRQYIPIGFIGSETIVSNLAFAIYECEPWIFSLLTSRMHNLWIRTVCGALETRLRYSNTLGYNTFPFPDISEAQKKTLEEFAYDIIAERECYPEKTLGDLYSDLPGTLRIKHEYLDVFVDSLFSQYGFKSDNERLEYLFQSYQSKS